MYYDYYYINIWKWEKPTETIENFQYYSYELIKKDLNISDNPNFVFLNKTYFEY